jgi:hypothetical protein
MEVIRSHVRAVSRMFKKSPLQLLNALLGCSGCMGSGFVMMKQYPSCQPGSFLHPEASTELHSTMQDSHFQHASENGLTVLSESPKKQ